MGGVWAGIAAPPGPPSDGPHPVRMPALLPAPDGAGGAALVIVV